MAVELFGTTGAAGARAAAKKVAGAAAGGGAEGFGDQLTKLIDGVEKAGGDANQAVNNMLDKSGEVHDAMIAMQRAEMALQLTVQIRNKLVSAYQDIMRMPV
jgi:flagellar hook-basal body complex protein FliE